MANTTRLLSGWGRYPQQLCTLTRPEKYHQLPIKQTTIARGQGRSYGDAALNNQGQVLLTERLNRVISFDRTQGIVTAEAGITLADILAFIVPAGWFLPVTPGTRYVSLGGCVAADVHGKNHHHVGSFCQYVLEIELINANNQTLICSPEHNAEIFWATVGGMGLTGIIGTVTLKLIPITTAYMAVKYYSSKNLEETFNYLSKQQYDDEYTVAWLDCSAAQNSFGRGIMMSAHHASPAELKNHPAEKLLQIPKYSSSNIPINAPSWLLNKYLIKMYNSYYYNKHSRITNPIITDYDKFFYPLDALNNWNRLYGKPGFTQYQCVLPNEQAYNGMKLILQKLAEHNITIPLAVLKRFGASKGGLLSFPMPGYTLSLDISLKYPDIFKLLDELDDIVINHSGRIYLAKDIRLNASNFRKMYASHQIWLLQKQKLDPDGIFNSNLASRIGLGI